MYRKNPVCAVQGPRFVWLLPEKLYVTLAALESLQHISVLGSGCFVFGEDSVLLRFKVNRDVVFVEAMCWSCVCH